MIKIQFPDGTVYRYTETHKATERIADLLNNLVLNGYLSDLDVTAAGDVQCGAGDLQCATGKPDGYYKEELGWPNREFVWIPFYDNKPED